MAEDDRQPEEGVDPEARIALLRTVEAAIFAAPEPLDETALEARTGAGPELPVILEELRTFYAGRGAVLVREAAGWAFRVAPDLKGRLELEVDRNRRPSAAMVQALVIIAYHQPVTRAQVDEMRGVRTNKAVFDQLQEAGWIRPGPRLKAPGAPQTWVTTEAFLEQFGLTSLRDLPSLEDLQSSGLLEGGAGR